MSALVPVRILGGRYTPFLRPSWGSAEWEAVAAWRTGSDLSEAPAALATELASRSGAAPVLASSGRAAIRATLQGARLRRGSEVIIPTYCCSAVAQAVVESGLQPVLADVDDELNLQLESTSAVAGPLASAVVVIHTGGVRAADGRVIAAWARDRGLLVIEDAAQCSPVDFDDPFGDATIFSSGPGKIHFGPGGGWVDVADEELRERVGGVVSGSDATDDVDARIEAFLARYPPSPGGVGDLRTRLRDRRSSNASHVHRGTAPHRIADIDAAIALGQVLRGAELVGMRRHNAERWRALLRDRHFNGVMAKDPGWASKVWVRTPGPIDDLMRQLWLQGVELERLYTPLHVRSEWAGAQRQPLATADDLWRRVAALPVRPDLDEADWKRISRATDTVVGRVA